MSRYFRGILLMAGILFLSASSANAQAIGSIFGKATDAQGGVLPGVTVTVTGPALQQPLTQVTQPSGAYQFPVVPIGTYTVTFELSGFKKAQRNGIVLTSGFNAPVDMKMEIGNMTEEVTVSAAPPVVDTKRTNVGGVFTADILEKIPTARDPWQIINMTPGVQAGLNVGGSSSGQQVGLSSRGTGANVQWNLEGGSITDLSSNSSPSYFNFDSFEQIQVTNGGGDVSVQSSGLSINLITKSGSNVFKGSSVITFENDKMQGNNVTKELFALGQNGFLSGAPLKKILVYSAEFGGPILRNKLWFWVAGDKQDINAGVLNFFNPAFGDLCSQLVAAQKAGTLATSGLVSYDKLEAVQKCLSNDTTIIKDLQWKFNYQLNASHKFQYLFQADNKFRNARGANANSTLESVTNQRSDMPKWIGYWGLPLPTHSFTHTFIASDRLVFNNQFTYVHGGFYLDYNADGVAAEKNCGGSYYLNSTSNSDYQSGPRAAATCMWNIQSLNNRTTGLNSRSLGSTYETARHSWEAKTDATYFLTNVLGGDHSFKFGVGWRRNPITTFTHFSGGAQVEVQCAGNLAANCGGGTFAAQGAASGLVPYRATVRRDGVSTTNDWWSWNGYIQDSYSRGRVRLNGGLRYDWQQSKYVGGCVPASVIRPDLLPSACAEATSVDSTTGKKLRPFSNVSPRLSATYDLFGNGKTSLRATGSFYYDTKITLANSLNQLGSIGLTWGPNAATGACTGTRCWTDANVDGIVQANELIGTPSSTTSRFDTATGLISPAGNIVSDDAKIGRTREATVGATHELISNLAIGVDFIYRKYDLGTSTYSVGYTPKADGSNPLAALYTGPLTYTDPITGKSAPYYIVCTGCVRPSGLADITVTDPNFRIYKGVDITMNKRYSNRWQAQVALTIQTNPGTTLDAADPTGFVFRDQINTGSRYIFKANGSVTLPFETTLSANFNMNEGGTRTLTINGPGQVYGGVTSTGAASTINRTTLEFQSRATTRFEALKLLDLGVQKTFSFREGKNRIKLMLDAFNVLNINDITGYASNNLSDARNINPGGIVPPRVFRVGGTIIF